MGTPDILNVMEAVASQFKELVESANRILVTSHISPDPDAVCSVLLTGLSLKLNFPDKDVELVLEENPSRDISFLDGYQDIEFKDVLQETAEFKPDLFIMLDAPNFERCSRRDGPKLRQQLSDLQTKVVIIDHHEEHGRDEADFYLNNRRPATAQELYEFLFEKMKFKRRKG